MTRGNFVISLDFELYWGVWDVIELEAYKENLLGVRKVIPGLLELFKEYNIQATFATVGFLFFNNKKELEEGLPNILPQYTNPGVSPYRSHLHLIGENEEADKFHYAPSLINMIIEAQQEIGSHSFSHYYCLEKGQTPESFRADLNAAIMIARKRNIHLKSFVFPRNQFTPDYLEACRDAGMLSYRGNERSSLFSSENYGRSMMFRRPFRFLDAYLNLSGHNCYSNKYMKKSILINIPSSRFLRPYSKRFSFLERIRLKRITASMTHAAKNGFTYHLWWHPHNFGINIQENLDFLRKILEHFRYLSEKYNFKSCGMHQLAEYLTSNDE